MLHDHVEQIARPHAVVCRHGNRIAQTKRGELVKVGAARVVDVGSPEQRDDRNAGVLHAAASPSRVRAGSVRSPPSTASTSMKSYDGYTGIGNPSRTSMNDCSSRKMPLSLIDSAGISARSRS